jgi:hypothetical protein
MGLRRLLVVSPMAPLSCWRLSREEALGDGGDVNADTDINRIAGKRDQVPDTSCALGAW